MIEFDVYKDIASRTGGDIYLGVVGPVRSGKSTFISRFMTEMIIPNIQGNDKNVAETELPQSASGKTIMTTEPKFVPSEAVKVNFDGAVAKVKLIDCVGFMVDGALGTEENGSVRMVKTPWSDELIDFSTASEIGTEKVIREHSTASIVVTTDGSFTELERSSYERAEERVVKELKSLGKPFIIVYNTVNTESKKAIAECKALEEKYGVGVVCANIQKMDKSKFNDIIKTLLMQFELRSFDVVLPSFLQALPCDNRLIDGLICKLKETFSLVSSMKSFYVVEKMLSQMEGFLPSCQVEMDMANGSGKITLFADDKLFYKVLSEECGEEINEEFELFNYIKELSRAKSGYEKIKNALECCEASGYGIVLPTFADATLTEPEVVKKPSGYAVQLKAKSKCLHIISTDVETDVNAVYGSQSQCEDFVEFFKKSSPEKCWETPVFGKKLCQIIGDEINGSCVVSDNIKLKLKKNLSRAVNEKKNNIFCILF